MLSQLTLLFMMNVVILDEDTIKLRKAFYGGKFLKKMKIIR